MEIAFGLRGLFVVNPSLGRRDFDQALARLEITGRYPEIKNVAFTRHVTAQEKDAFERQVRQDTSVHPLGYPKFAVYPPGDRSEYFVADYIWPIRGNEGIQGLDISAQPANLASMQYSMRTGKPVASGPFNLLQEKDHRTGFVIRVPVFSAPRDPGSGQAVSTNFLGSVAITLRVFDLLAQLNREGKQTGLLFTLTDQGSSIVDFAQTTRLPLYESTPSSLTQGISYSREVDMYGRRWKLDFVADSTFSSDSERRAPGLIGAGSAVISLLLGLLVTLLAKGQSSARARALASDEARQEIEERWKFAIEGSGDGLWDWDVPKEKVFFSLRWKEMLGFADAEIADDFKEWHDRVHPDDLAATMVRVQAHLRGSTPLYISEQRMRCKDGSWKWVLARGKVMSRAATGQPLRMIGTHTDVSDRRSHAQALELSLKDKEALLKEVHHRVKNNLQVVTSLLRMEGRRSTLTEIKDVLGDMQGRIRSMALLHGLLYQSGTYAVVNLGDYVKELAGQAFSSQVRNNGSVQLKFDIASVQVDMDQAMHCGLLVNELVSNCLKHGFPDGHTGVVTVRVQPAPDGKLWQLRVTDTGVGPPPDFKEKFSDSLGLQLITDLADQLEGALEMTSFPARGLEVTVTFKIKEAAIAAQTQ